MVPGFWSLSSDRKDLGYLVNYNNYIEEKKKILNFQTQDT